MGRKQLADVYVSYDELQVGDIFLGTTRNRDWRCENRITRRNDRTVWYSQDGGEVSFKLWNDPDRKYRLKETKFKYDPEQTGDTEDDI